MKPIFLITLFTVITTGTAQAELFKCVKDEQVSYQATPCTNGTKQTAVEIKQETEEEKAKAAEKLKAIREQYEANKVRQAEINKQHTDSKLKTEQVNAARQGAEAERRQADALEEQARKPPAVVVIH